MPNFDKTGPMGKGPRTGRGRGGCDATDMKKFKQMGLFKGTSNKERNRPMDGRGRGRGPGLGIGRK